ncbi:IS1182 family transposase [Arthrobacter sp. VKM Ac-2550]|uniref:IS1182 family transposase n=1 Tax=Crystallibacter permensis TaxID=1938888 RepID=UPI002227AC68|nr:IS1182 family transposase [Arthrobacter sp. VKM Ac-2550]MCW2135469.1 Transposase [Arthrobacter sp. VKM Ac-2550]
MDSDAQDGLFDERLVERVEPAGGDVVEAGAGVNKRFKPFDPDAVMLVPPSLDEWLPDNHLARFIADLVAEELDLSRFYDSYAKTKGQPPYDPRLMVRILLYGYCTGVRSSRELERACVDVVAFRWLAAQQAPDFRSIGRFRKRHLSVLGNVFLQALELCRAAGMVSLGRVALDGTKVRANASRRKAMSYARLTEKQKVLAQEVSDLLADAEATDASEDARYGKDKRGDELPAELAEKTSRLAKMAAARKQLEEEAADKARKEAERKARDRGDDDDTVAAKGAEAAAEAAVKPTAQRNFTDPDARIMKTADGSYHYCYTGQAVVDADHQVIVTNELNNTAVDVQQLAPMIENTAETLGQLPSQWTIDAGYCSAGNLEHVRQIEADNDGSTEFFIATGRLKHGEQVQDAPRGRIPNNATAKERMARKLKTKRGKAVYARRKAIIEPVFGQIHTRQGKHVLLRGLEQARQEWNLIAGCHNLLKLFKFRADAQAAAPALA